MKKFKKILALALSLAMVLGMSVTTFAATKADGKTEFGTEGDKGSIEIAGIAKEDGINIALYPVVEAVYDTQTKVFLRYDVAKGADGNALYTLNKDADGNYIIDQDALDAIGTTAQTSGTALTGVNWTYDETDKVYKTTTDCVPVGMYLVVITGAETKIYNYAVASLYYTVEEGENAVGGGTLTLKNANAIVKVSSHPDVNKTAKDAAEDGKVVTSADIGDLIYYTLPITNVPYYGGDNPVLNLVDTLSDGLSFQESSLAVKTTAADGTAVTLNKGTDYTLTVGPTKDAEGNFVLTAGQIKIDFVVGDQYKLNDYAGKTVTVTYAARLNEHAAINEAGNSNGVVLNYTKDSKVENAPGHTDEKKTYTYTFDIDGAVSGSVTEKIVTKIGEELKNGSYALDGAVFTLYTENPDGLSDTQLANAVYKNYKYDADGTSTELFGGTVTSKDGGQLPIKGLAEGTYYLKETTAPNGYTLNAHVYTIEIQGTYEKNNDTENKGKLVSWTITIDGQTTNTFTVDQGNVVINKDVEDSEHNSLEGSVIGTDIKNTKINQLPSTGGIGTTIFTIGGCAIMIIAAGLYFASRRRSAK